MPECEELQTFPLILAKLSMFVTIVFALTAYVVQIAPYSVQMTHVKLGTLLGCMECDALDGLPVTSHREHICYAQAVHVKCTENRGCHCCLSGHGMN